MSVAIRNAANYPPEGGWGVSLNIKGQKFSFRGTPHRIHHQVVQLYKKNKIYEGDDEVWKELNTIWCHRDPSRCTVGKGTDIYGRPSVRSKAKNFLKAVTAKLRAGGKAASQDLATERAKVCASCPLNMKQTKCGSCLNALKATAKLILKGKKSTIYDSKLNECAACGCMLSVKVFYPLVEEDDVNYRPGCWVLKERDAKTANSLDESLPDLRQES